MSMRWLTILQFLEIFAAYGIVTLFLPWRILGKRFHRFSVAEQLIAYFFAGNFYIIYLVYLLQFLRISSRVTLLLGTAGPFLFVWIRKRKKQIPGAIESLLVWIERLLDKEWGKKTSLVQLRRAVSERCFRGKRKQWLHALPEIAVLLAAIAAITYVYGPNMVETFGYKASDIPVHNYWINELEWNNIWVAGVYPYGFHIVIYYLHMVFGIPTYVLLRIFGVVQTYFVYLALVAALKMVCRGRFTPYFGILFYVMDIFNWSTYARFESALPQEFSMIFVLTSVCMAIRFFQEFAKERNGNCRWYLVQFAIGFSLTLTVHFYGTMAAGLFCIGVAVGFCFRFFRWNYFRRILITGILSVLLSVLPMAAGVAMGKGLQGSLYWGMNVITGDKKQEDADTAGTLSQDGVSDSLTAGETESSGNTTKNGETGSVLSQSRIEELRKEAEERIQKQQKPLAERLKEKGSAVRESIRINVMNVKPHMAEITLGSIAVLLLLGIFLLVLRENGFAGAVLSAAVYLLCMCSLQCASLLHLPALMDANRCGIFLCYAICFAWALGVDAVVYLAIRRWKRRWIGEMASLLTLVMAVTVVLSQGLIREPVKVGALEDNGAMVCITNILRENKDFTWTICSANDELRMTEFYGYHYETITLLNQLKDLGQNPEIIIPTKCVYFFIEKIPVSVDGSTGHEEVTEEGAKEPVPGGSGILPYTKESRWITMSHMYEWAQRFQELYPNEMEVYYESDSFICYRLQQNVNSPYNLAIDYGYNNPMPK